MTSEKFHYLKNQAIKNKAEFLLCDGVIYRVKVMRFPTGDSPFYDIEPLEPKEIPPFIPDPHYYD